MLAPITVVYGPNGSGKSSLIYALMTLKHLVLNPNRRTDDLFNYQFLNLGNFNAVVFNHKSNESIELSISVDAEGYNVHYNVTIGKENGLLTLAVRRGEQPVTDLTMPVSFPYSATSQEEQDFAVDQREYHATWNGFAAQVAATSGNDNVEALKLATVMNAPFEFLRGISMVPLQRGFSKPFYSAVPISQFVVTEDEVASLLANEKYLAMAVSHYLEAIISRDFRINSQPGTAIFTLDTTDKLTGMASELVNEGYGVNQLVHLLARALRQDVTMVCVEEPEVHLHPSAIRELVRVIAAIHHDQGKRFLISTHSEVLVLALLTLLANGNLKTSDVAFYLSEKPQKSSTFVRQEALANGQLEGGLGSFMVGELEDLEAFLAATK